MEVPKPKTTAPTTAMGRRIRVAKATAPRTNPSPPTSNITSPATIITAFIDHWSLAVARSVTRMFLVNWVGRARATRGKPRNSARAI